MKRDRFDEAESIFQVAADLFPEEREAVLFERCGNDSELLSIVNRLLGHHDAGMSRFLHPPDAGPPRLLDVEAILPDYIGDYEILRRIGEGGMATVFEARHNNLRRVVALKVIKGALGNTSLIRRFRFETKVLAHLSHPGIARVYEAGETADGIPYFAMELVDGLSLTQYAGERQLDTAERFELMARVCDAVHYAHESGVIHRDLKPANILVTDETGGKSDPKILDFGVARALRADLQTVSMHTSTGQLVGTLAYMSPEQIIGNPDDLDVRSDVYQLGVVLYELLAGKRPYAVTDLSVPQAGRVILEEEPPRLRTVDSSYRGDVEAIVGKALSKERERRYASAAEMAADIRRHLNHEPIAARPSSGFYRLRKLARRRKEVFTGLAIGLVGAVALGAAILISAGETGPEKPAPPQAIQLTALPREVALVDAAISADGSTLAYTSTRGIFVQDIESKETVPLELPDGYGHVMGFVRWHPTENTILTRLVGEGGGAWHSVARNGEIQPLINPRIVEEIGNMPRDVRISPDGKKWLFQSADWRELWVMDGDAGSLKKLIHVSESSYVESPVWSPTGETIAYLRSDSNTDACVLWTVDLDGNTVALGEPDARLTQRYAVGGGPTLLWWLADGRLLYSRAMAPPNTLSSEIWALPVDPTAGVPLGKPESLIGWVGFGISSLAASAAGDRLSCRKLEKQDEIYLAELDADGLLAGDPARFTVDERIDRLGLWSPDGKGIFFQSRRFGNWDVLFKRPGDPTPTRFLAGPEHEIPIGLTPDGSHLLVSLLPFEGSETSNSRAILRIPVSGGDPELLTRIDRTERIKCGAVSGAPCVLSRPTETGVVFYRLDENWLPAAELGRANTGNVDHFWAVAPSGRELALATWDGAIRILTLKTGEWRLLCKERAGLQTIAFAPDGESIYVSRMNPNSIVRIDRRGESEQLWVSRRDWLWSPRVSPDGKRIAFGVREYDEDIWMIEGF